MPLVVPIRASHVNAAYAEAQVDPDNFIHREIRRLRIAHTLLAANAEQTFDTHMRWDGHDMAGPFALGFAIGSVSVGHCIEETGDSTSVRLAYSHNARLGYSMPDGVVPPAWNTEGVLDDVFKSRELTDALMQIQDPLTRAAAASTIGYLCLDRIPNVPALAPAPSLATV